MAKQSEIGSGAGSTLYLNEARSDVTIVVECDSLKFRFPAHSLLLCAMSDVINSMMELEMSEKANHKIVIEDCNPSTVKQFLKYIYTGQMNVGEWQDVADLLVVAHKYQVASLIEICEGKLLQALTLSRACVLYEMSDLYSLKTLKLESGELILNCAFAINHTEGFENLSPTSLEFFLSSRLLNVESEISVLRSLRNWGKAECIRRGVKITMTNVIDFIAPFIQHIRLNSIPSDKRTLIPVKMAKNRTANNDLHRVRFFVSSLIHDHLASIKFVVELGSFLNKSLIDPLICAKFSTDKNVFIMGFRIVGLFRKHSFGDHERNRFNGMSSVLTLCREGTKEKQASFDLGSVPWKSGAHVGDNIWREVVAYLPRPARIQQFACYNLSIKCDLKTFTKWPKTRVEFSKIPTELGDINFYTFGQCYGLTELLVLPAPELLQSCNDLLE